MLFRALLLLSILVIGAVTIEAQINSSAGAAVGADRSSPGQSSNGDLGTPEDEMRARNEIKVAEKERQENLERAREAAQLGEEIRQAFSKTRTLSSPELKKLDRMARRIRSRAGGEDDDEPLNNVPTALDAALNRLAETSESLYKGVEKTPKMVISTTVIERANELLEIIRFIRSNTR
jgi:hypothetical protein